MTAYLQVIAPPIMNKVSPTDFGIVEYWVTI